MRSSIAMYLHCMSMSFRQGFWNVMLEASNVQVLSRHTGTAEHDTIQTGTGIVHLSALEYVCF